MEKLFYEARPFFFMAISIVGLWKNNGTMLMIGSSLMLLLCAAYVVYLRHGYRKFYRIPSSR